MFEVVYVGSKGTHVEKRYDDNYSPPGPGNVDDKRRYKIHRHSGDVHRQRCRTYLWLPFRWQFDLPRFCDQASKSGFERIHSLTSYTFPRRRSATSAECGVG